MVFCIVDGRAIICSHVVDHSLDKRDEGSSSREVGDEYCAPTTGQQCDVCSHNCRHCVYHLSRADACFEDCLLPGAVRDVLKLNDVWIFTYDIANMFIILNSAVNFFIYILANKRFRDVLTETICRRHVDTLVVTAARPIASAEEPADDPPPELQ